MCNADVVKWTLKEFIGFCYETDVLPISGYRGHYGSLNKCLTYCAWRLPIRQVKVKVEII